MRDKIKLVSTDWENGH